MYYVFWIAIGLTYEPFKDVIDRKVTFKGLKDSRIYV